MFELSLAELDSGHHAVITRVDDNHPSALKLRRLGLNEGACVEIVRGEDPAMVRCGTSQVALARELLFAVHGCPLGNKHMPGGNAMKLSDLGRGIMASVVGIDADQVLSQRLMALGIQVSAPVKVVQIAPLGDPITIDCGGVRVSLRKKDASLVDVEPILATS